MPKMNSCIDVSYIERQEALSPTRIIYTWTICTFQYFSAAESFLSNYSSLL